MRSIDSEGLGIESRENPTQRPRRCRLPSSICAPILSLFLVCTLAGCNKSEVVVEEVSEPIPSATPAPPETPAPLEPLLSAATPPPPREGTILQRPVPENPPITPTATVIPETAVPVDKSEPWEKMSDEEYLKYRDYDLDDAEVVYSIVSNQEEFEKVLAAKFRFVLEGGIQEFKLKNIGGDNTDVALSQAYGRGILLDFLMGKLGNPIKLFPADPGSGLFGVVATGTDPNKTPKYSGLSEIALYTRGFGQWVINNDDITVSGTTIFTDEKSEAEAIADQYAMRFQLEKYSLQK